jgi:uncharacterized membrane protein YdjX (TVP38/TMEM64 family)
MKPSLKIILALSLVITMVMVSYVFDFNLWSNDSYLKTKLLEYQHLYHLKPILFSASFALVYILVAALSIPLATTLGLLAGALFGPLLGTIIVSFCSTIGASLCFLIARYLFKETLQARYHDRLAKVHHHLEINGSYYLLSLRLMPAMPFFLTNILMGLTPIKTATFFWVSQLGMLPGTFIYVNAGSELSRLETLSDIMSPKMLLALSLLAALPLLSLFLKGKNSH